MSGLTPKERAAVGPRALKELGSPEWCWQTVEYLKESMRHVAEQYRQAEQVLDDLKRVKAWTKIPPEKPYGSLDAMLKAEVGLGVEQVRGQIKSAKDRAKALEGKRINTKRGGPISKQNDANCDNITVRGATDGGTSADYLTRRIARDHPEILRRMQAGEFPSVRAAALEAGIVPRTQTVRVNDPESVARTLRRYMTPEQLAELVRMLAEDEGNR